MPVAAAAVCSIDCDKGDSFELSCWFANKSIENKTCLLVDDDVVNTGKVSEQKSDVRNNLLLVLLISGVTIGLLIGVLVNPEVNRISDPEKKATTVMLIGFPGELLMNMLRMLILPLVMASLITAVSGLNPTEAGRIGRRTIMYYMSTMVLAALLGLVLVVTIQPGKRDKPGEQGTSDDTVKYRNLDSLLDILRYECNVC